MANAPVKEGREMLALMPSRGSVAAAIEAFTAVCVTLNIRHKAHSTLRMAGI